MCWALSGVTPGWDSTTRSTCIATLLLFGALDTAVLGTACVYAAESHLNFQLPTAPCLLQALQ